MTVVRRIDLVCETGCGAQYYGGPDMWVDGPVRSEAYHYGWRVIEGKDFCPDCVAKIKKQGMP